jgi:hypothetical protein
MAKNNYKCTWQKIALCQIYTMSQSTGDFNAAMNFRNYNEWLIEKVILNLLTHSAVVTTQAATPP